MFAFYSPEVDSLRADDIAGIQSLYGRTPVGGDEPPTSPAEVSGSLSGTGDRDVWTAALGSGQISVELAGPDDADFDLYLRAGEAPTPRNYDVRGFTGDSSESVSFNHPGGTLYIAVESYQGSGEYQLRIQSPS